MTDAATLTVAMPGGPSLVYAISGLPTLNLSGEGGEVGVGDAARDADMA